MGYDKTLDVVIKDYDDIELSDYVSVGLSLISYDGKTPKLQLTRKVKSRSGDVRERTMARFTYAEVVALIDGLKEPLADRKPWGG